MRNLHIMQVCSKPCPIKEDKRVELSTGFFFQNRGFKCVLETTVRSGSEWWGVIVNGIMGHQAPGIWELVQFSDPSNCNNFSSTERVRRTSVDWVDGGRWWVGVGWHFQVYKSGPLFISSKGKYYLWFLASISDFLQHDLIVNIGSSPTSHWMFYSKLRQLPDLQHNRYPCDMTLNCHGLYIHGIYVTVYQCMESD
jgi:hypothetical protein